MAAGVESPLAKRLFGGSCAIFCSSIKWKKTLNYTPRLFGIAMIAGERILFDLSLESSTKRRCSRCETNTEYNLGKLAIGTRPQLLLLVGIVGVFLAQTAWRSNGCVFYWRFLWHVFLLVDRFIGAPACKSYSETEGKFVSEAIKEFKQLIQAKLDDARDQFVGGFGDGSEVEKLEAGIEFVQWLENQSNSSLVGIARLRQLIQEKFYDLRVLCVQGNMRIHDITMAEGNILEMLNTLRKVD